jgi:secondary thiamine-phosphate synthase enzyme
MNWHKDTLEIKTRGKGLHPITDAVIARLHQWNVREGMCFLYIGHTSASLVVNESYDPSARADMEAFMEHLAPESQPWHQHTLEGADDSPSHMRAIVTDASLSIPIDDGELSLGTWQGIYLFEHRARGQRRKVMLRVLAVE